MEQNEQNNVQNQTNVEKKEAHKAINKTVKKSMHKKKFKKHHVVEKAKVKPEKKIIKEKKEKKNKILIVLGIVLVLLIAIGLYFVLSNSKMFSNKKTSNTENSNINLKEEVLVEIDGEKITTKDLNNYLNSVPKEMRNQVDVPRAINDLIIQKLFLNDAKAKGLKIDESEITQVFDAYLAQMNMTKEQFKQQLEAQGIDYNSYYSNLKLLIILNKYMEEYLINQVTVSEDEIKDFYEQMQIFFGNATYDEVKSDLEMYVKQIKLQEYMVKYLETLKSNAKITIYKYNVELCLLNEGLTDKFYLYSSENCEPCKEYKKLLDDKNITYYEFSDEKIKTCFKTSIDKVKGIMPVLLCRDGSFTMSKSDAEIDKFVSSCK
ncbi:MAG: SurA N-terminal domain-containing protein [Candidatus Woesearchaeota archaeon]